MDSKIIYKLTNNIIHKMNVASDSSYSRTLLAKLRNSIGRDFRQSVDLWSFIFAELPDDYLGTGGNLTKEERAIFTTLQLYAKHQQGNLQCVHENGVKPNNIGYSLKQLRNEDKNEAVDRRFNAMITASSYEELEYHLRQMIALLKAKTEATIDYALLASDLYWFLQGQQEKIALKWARAYYRQIKENKNESK